MKPELFDNCSVLRFLFSKPFIEVLGCLQQIENKWAMFLHSVTAICQVVVHQWMPWQSNMFSLSLTVDGGKKRNNRFGVGYQKKCED